MANDIAVIDPHGDVLLVVGKEKRGKLRVSSSMLTQTSRVFEALLGPHFKEGQQERNSSNPVEVALPDDDLEIMAIICTQLHPGSSIGISQSISTAQGDLLLQYAITADKYDLIEVLKLQAQGLLLSWLCNKKYTHDLNNLGNIITASYLLHQSQAFQMATEKLLADAYPRLSTVDLDSCWNLLPHSVIGKPFLAPSPCLCIELTESLSHAS